MNCPKSNKLFDGLLNMISISSRIMSYFMFVRTWIVDFEIKFGIHYLMVAV